MSNVTVNKPYTQTEISMTDKKKKNPPLGSTRKQYTEAETEWEKNFDRAHDDRDIKALAKIVPKPEMLPELIREVTQADDARRRDIYNNQIPIHAEYTDKEGNDLAHDVALESIIYDPLQRSIEDETLAPAYPTRAKNERYTAEDYIPSYSRLPDEDGLIDAIDHDRAEAEKQKIKDFKKFKTSIRRKKLDSVS
jgi:hypothetical protein